MTNTNMIIKEMPETIRPRERLFQYGEKSLSEQELIAIILRTGTREKNVLDLSREILKYFDNLFELKQATVEEFQQIKGIGKVKAIELKAAIELGTRIANANQLKLGKVLSSTSIGTQLMQEMKDLQQEHLIAIYLNMKNEMIKRETVFIGSLNQAVAHPREIFKSAVKYSAARILIAHNHPSGVPTPSSNDISFTERIVECGNLMGIEVLDHIIVGANGYVSLREEGIF